jgi:formate-dependent nitrite reductase membrane component NrfD
MLKAPDWHLLIVWYFFLGGIAGGAYFTAAIADNFGSPRDKSVFRIGYVLALLLIGLCGIVLILDLGTPSRFLNMVTNFKFWDPMSIGAWMLGVFGLFAFVSSALSFAGGEGVAPLRRRLSLIGTISGFFIAAYTGVLLSATTLPFWTDARLMGALFLASGASTGMAAISLLLYLSGESAGEGFSKVKRADRYAIMFEIVVLAAFLVLWGGAAGPIVSGQMAPLLWGASCLSGLSSRCWWISSGSSCPGPCPPPSCWSAGSSCATSSSWPTPELGSPSRDAPRAPTRGPLVFPDGRGTIGRCAPISSSRAAAWTRSRAKSSASSR